MSEERKMILQMVAEGKISTAEADMLLQAIDEGERTVQSAAAEGVRENRRNTGFLENLGETIERAVNDSLGTLDRELRHLEVRLDRKLKDHEQLRPKIEEKLRRAAERTVERASAAEERAARVAERTAARFIKTGIAIDKETAEQVQSLTLPAEDGDRFRLENRVGDLTVEYYDGSEVAVEVKKTVWGEDRADAEARAGATLVHLERRGSTVEVLVDRPVISAVGVVILKDTRLDYTVRLPQGAHLELANKVGDIKVTGALQVGTWSIATKVGDVDLAIPSGAGFRYDLRSAMGAVVMALPERQQCGSDAAGQVGDGTGKITATVKTGDIRIHH